MGPTRLDLVAPRTSSRAVRKKGDGWHGRASGCCIAYTHMYIYNYYVCMYIYMYICIYCTCKYVGARAGVQPLGFVA